jgi:beta-lactamase class A
MNLLHAHNPTRLGGIAIAGAVLLITLAVPPARAQLTLRPDVAIPELPGFRRLPPADAQFSAKVAEMVKQAQLDEHTPADKNPDKEEEWSSVCVVDLSDPRAPRVGEWEAENFIYPASTYKMYVLGEAIRQVCAGERSLDDVTTVSANNMRADTRLTTGQLVSLSEVLRLMCQYSDNTAANVAIDTVDRQRASALLRATGCEGSDITRKFLPRTREDAQYTTVPGTTTCARHAATFLWAVEQGAIGGGRGRGLIKGFLATNVANATRLRAGLPRSATIQSKTGEWDTFTSEAAIVEDGPVRYIVCVFTALPEEKAGARIAAFGKAAHALLATPR